MAPAHRVPVRRPLVTQTKRYLVRLWEIPRASGRQVKPEQIEGFTVEAVTQNDALVLAKAELREKRKRVIRSISIRDDGSIQAVVFSDERRARPGSATHAIRQVTSAHMRRRAAAQRVRAEREHEKAPRPIDKINAQRLKNRADQETRKVETIADSLAKPAVVDKAGELRRAEIQAQRAEQAARRTTQADARATARAEKAE